MGPQLCVCSCWLLTAGRAPSPKSSSARGRVGAAQGLLPAGPRGSSLLLFSQNRGVAHFPVGQHFHEEGASPGVQGGWVCPGIRVGCGCGTGVHGVGAWQVGVPGASVCPLGSNAGRVSSESRGWRWKPGSCGAVDPRPALGIPRFLWKLRSCGGGVFCLRAAESAWARGGSLAL